MDQSPASAAPRVVEYGYPAVDGAPRVGRIISRCQDPAAAIMMVTSQSSSVVIVGDESLIALHGGFIDRLVGECAVPVHVIPFAQGESSKSLSVLEDVFGVMARENVDRSCVVVGFGGGVATDLAGMVAGLWMRGVRLVQVPTSLLAMADAAVGGKCAVNIPDGRNLAGCMKFPEYVFVDGRFLNTLPRSEFAGGLVEIIKTGIVDGPSVLEMLADAGDWFNVDFAADIAVETAAVKMKLVSRDPFDQGVRALLNFGHTVGHAIESAAGYAIGHGQAVAAGMRVESAASERLGIWTSADRGRLVSLLDRTGVDTAPVVDFAAAEPFILRDKKNLGGRVRLALPVHAPGSAAPGEFAPMAVSISLIRECWND